MRRLIKRIIRGTRFRIRRLAISVANFVLPRLPTRAVLGIVYLAQALHLPGQYTLLGHLISNATARQKHKPDSPLDILSAIHELKPFSRTDAMALLMARTFFELGEFERAHAMLTNSDGRDAVNLDPPAAHLQGLLELCAGNESGAEIPLRIATADMPHLMAPHQNLAARDPSDYDPTPLDDAAGPDGRLFDAYNFLGQRVTHVGMGQLSTELYARALSAQKRLQRSTPPVSPACTSYLADLGISLSNVKIFASEWQTQIGHEGMLDIELRMRELGWWKGEPIVLVSSDRVANSAFLSLFEHHVRLLQLDSGVPHDIARELSSLQRYYGMSFNAFEMPDGMVVQWSEAAASAIRQWDEEGRQPPLRVEFDRRFASSEALTATLEEARRSWGMSSFARWIILRRSERPRTEPPQQRHRKLSCGDRIHYGTRRMGHQTRRKRLAETTIDAARDRLRPQFLQIRPHGLVSDPRRQAFHRYDFWTNERADQLWHPGSSGQLHQHRRPALASARSFYDEANYSQEWPGGRPNGTHTISMALASVRCRRAGTARRNIGRQHVRRDS